MQWLKITGGKEVLEKISGIKLDFEYETQEKNKSYEQRFSKRLNI